MHLPFPFQGDAREALVDLEHALSIDPHNKMALVYRAECNTKLGHKEDAVEDYQVGVMSLITPSKPQQP